MTIADTFVWVDYFGGSQTPAVARLRALLLEERDVGVGDIILCEVLQGFRLPREYESAKAELLKLTTIPMVNAEIAVRVADNYRTLRRLGITV